MNRSKKNGLSQNSTATRASKERAARIRLRGYYIDSPKPVHDEEQNLLTGLGLAAFRNAFKRNSVLVRVPFRVRV